LGVCLEVSRIPNSVSADDYIQGGAGQYKECVIQFLCQLYKSSGLEQAFFKKKEQRPTWEGLDPKALVLPIVHAANEAIL